MKPKPRVESSSSQRQQVMIKGAQQKNEIHMIVEQIKSTDIVQCADIDGKNFCAISCTHVGT